MPSSRRNLALAASAAFAVWLQYLGGPAPLHALVLVVLTLVVGAAVTWRLAVTGLRAQLPVGLLTGAAVAGTVVLVSTWAGAEGASALVAVVLALSAGTLLTPVRPRVRLRDRLAAALDDGAAPAPGAPARAVVEADIPVDPSDPTLSLQVLEALSVDLPGGDRRTGAVAPSPVARNRRAVR